MDELKGDNYEVRQNQYNLSMIVMTEENNYEEIEVLNFWKNVHLGADSRLCACIGAIY